jgi:penicillin-binding protein-related factor A (putative recombinase)
MSINNPLEKDIENAILLYLHMIGIFAWKNQSVGTFDPGKGLFRRSNNKFHIKGTSDILGILKDGRFLAIEVKRPSTKKQTTPHQRNFLEQINKNGGVGFVATSIKEVEEKLASLHKTRLE